MVLPSAATTATSPEERRIVLTSLALIFLCFLYDLPGFTEAAIGPTQLRRGFYSRWGGGGGGGCKTVKHSSSGGKKKAYKLFC